MPKGKRSPQTAAAEMALALRSKFKQNRPPSRRRLERDINMLVREGSAAEAALTFAAIPARPEYAQVRMLLLARVLLLPEFELLTPWYEEKFENLEFLPKEHAAIAAYCRTHCMTLQYVDTGPTAH